MVGRDVCEHKTGKTEVKELHVIISHHLGLDALLGEHFLDFPICIGYVAFSGPILIDFAKRFF